MESRLLVFLAKKPEKTRLPAGNIHITPVEIHVVCF